MNKNYEILLKNIAFTDNVLEYQFDGIESELEKFFSALDTKEQILLRYRYGLDDGKFKTIDEVAEDFKMTKKRVSQIETLIFRKLRVLFGINNNSFVFNPTKIIEDAEALLELQQFYDRFYATGEKVAESSVTKYYKKLIDISKKLNNKNNKKKIKTNKTNLHK